MVISALPFVAGVVRRGDFDLIRRHGARLGLHPDNRGHLLRLHDRSVTR
jgi:hypothetical protein